MQFELDQLSNIGGVGGYVIVTALPNGSFNVQFEGALSDKAQNLMFINGDDNGYVWELGGDLASETQTGGTPQVINGTTGTAGVGPTFDNPGSPDAPDTHAGIWRLDPTTDGTWFCMTDYISQARATDAGGQSTPPDTPGPDDDFRITFPYFADPYTGAEDNFANWTNVQVIDTGIQDDGLGGPASPVVYGALGSSGATENVANGVYRCEDPTTDQPVWYIGDPGIANDQIDFISLTNQTGAGGAFNLELPGPNDSGFGGNGSIPDNPNANWTQPPINGFNAAAGTDLSGQIQGALNRLPYIASVNGAFVVVTLDTADSTAKTQVYDIEFEGSMKDSPQALVAVFGTSQFSSVSWGVVQEGGGVDTENTNAEEFPSYFNATDPITDTGPGTLYADGNIKIAVINAPRRLSTMWTTSPSLPRFPTRPATSSAFTSATTRSPIPSTRATTRSARPAAAATPGPSPRPSPATTSAARAITTMPFTPIRTRTGRRPTH